MADAVHQPSRRAVLLAVAAVGPAAAMTMAAGDAAGGAEDTVFDLRLDSLDGGPLGLGAFRGRPMLVVRVCTRNELGLEGWSGG